MEAGHAADLVAGFASGRVDWIDLLTFGEVESLLAGAKLAVACHRFERERGRFPETLAELVPEYLDALPRDPYDGAPFRYSTEKGQVWAVGKNLTDEGGSTRVPGADKEYVASRHRRRAEDFVFELRPAEAE